MAIAPNTNSLTFSTNYTAEVTATAVIVRYRPTDGDVWETVLTVNQVAGDRTIEWSGRKPTSAVHSRVKQLVVHEFGRTAWDTLQRMGYQAVRPSYFD